MNVHSIYGTHRNWRNTSLHTSRVTALTSWLPTIYAPPTFGSILKDTMRPLLLFAALLCLAPSAAFAQAKPAANKPADMKLKIGDTAPDFTLHDQNGKEVKLSDFRGKENVALAFYVFAFTGG